MTNEPELDDPVDTIALLAERRRRRLYELVVASEEPVGRDEAAAALGMSRDLAAFHLDRLVDGGLLETEYRRRSGRSGPGAGRPAKLYRRAGRELAVSFPPRRYDRAAEIFAAALTRMEGTAGPDAVREIARGQGAAAGTEARRLAGSRPGHRRLMAALMALLRRGGYAPWVDAASGTVCLANCPYQSLASSHRDLTCGMNLAWATGVVGGLSDPKLEAELAPAPGRCCVVFRSEPAAGSSRR